MPSPPPAMTTTTTTTTALTADIDERERMAKEIARTRESIRKKHRSLKTGRIEDELALERHFKPIVEPLHELVEKIEPTERYKVGVKRKFEDDDGAAATSRLTPLKPTKRRRRSAAPLKTIPAVLAGDADDDEAIPTPEPPASPTLLERSVDELVRTSSGGRESLLQRLGPLGRKYVGALLSGDRSKIVDTTFGVYFGEEGTMLGNKSFDIGSDDSIIVDGARYAGTPGLYELIFMKQPDNTMYTENDKRVYRDLLLATNAHRRDHQPTAPIKSNRGYKYKHIIAPLLFNAARDATGEGLRPTAMKLTNNPIDYVHWDDPNELVDRLRLLDASRRAGNDSHDNEFLSIVEELREAGVIIN